MSGIVLSSSVRQNLLSLQSTADLLATTQSRLSTGKKVNSALDNPTNFFTAQGLDNRASDINNLLDGIGNGVQVLQAANTGITSLQKLVDSAKSVANQALQAAVGFSAKSNVTTASIAGATADNLLGTGAATAGALTAGTFSAINVSGTAPAATSGTRTAGAFSTVNVSGTASAATAGVNTGGAFSGPLDLSTGSVTFDVAVNGGSAQTVTIDAAAVTNYNSANSTSLTAASLSATDFSDLINAQVTGATSSVVGGAIRFTSGTTGASSSVAISSYASTAASGTTGLANGAGTAGAAAVAAASESFTVTLDGGSPSTVTLSAATVSAYNSANNASFNASSLSAANVAAIANFQTGTTSASVVGGALTFTSSTTGASSTVATSAVTSQGTASGSTGVTAATNTGLASGPSPLSGLTLTIGATGSTGVATNITFGTGSGQVKSLNDLNAALSANNLQATLDTTGKINITTTNDAASSTIGTIGGTAAGTGKAFNGLTAGAPVQDTAALTNRSNLVTQYNNILDQISSTAQDASYNGVNLLSGDKLKLTFNETGKSTLNIQGVQFNATGLGLSKLNTATDFTDNSSANAAIASLGNASSTLRTQASSLGSNLSIVQIRQDFSKNLINVLQTGSSNLTLADTNEEAANSQALSTRQSIAVSALSLANTSQQSVLQLLR